MNLLCGDAYHGNSGAMLVLSLLVVRVVEDGRVCREANDGPRNLSAYNEWEFIRRINSPAIGSIDKVDTEVVNFDNQMLRFNGRERYLGFLENLRTTSLSDGYGLDRRRVCHIAAFRRRLIQ